MLKAMIVDDSALYRKCVAEVLNSDPSIDVVGTAINGKMALKKISCLRPDVITLDMEMPEMGGLETLRQLKAEHPFIKSIVFSAHTEKGAEMTLKALKLGAVDFVTKPSNGKSIEMSLKRMHDELLPIVQVFAEKKRKAAKGGTSSIAGMRESEKLAIPETCPLPRPCDVIVIGVSTGGPANLARFCSMLPADLPQAILIVQHMPPIFTTKLAAQLDMIANVPVKEARNNEPLLGGKVYLAPGDFHMEVADGTNGKVIILNKNAPERFCRPSVNVLFRAAARHFGNRAIGVIMTGMGDDGLLGSRELHAAGCAIFAEDESTCTVFGMPKVIIEDGLACAVAPIDKLWSLIRSFTFNTRKYNGK